MACDSLACRAPVVPCIHIQSDNHRTSQVGCTMHHYATCPCAMCQLCHVLMEPCPCAHLATCPCAHVTFSVCPHIRELMCQIALYPEPLSPPEPPSSAQHPNSAVAVGNLAMQHPKETGLGTLKERGCQIWGTLKY